MLDTTFEKLGLKREHSDVYLALLQGGIMPVGKLAKGLKFPRTTIYGLLDDLAKTGLVLQNEQNNVKLWQAIAPEGIKTIINERINELESTRSGFESMLESLKKSQKTDFVSPKFHYFEGADEMQIMFRDVLLYNDLQTEACWPIQDMLKVMGEEFLNEFNKKRIAFTHFPDVAKKLAQSGKFDLVFYGHTHRPWDEKVISRDGKNIECHMINPGELAGQFYKPTFAVYDTTSGSLELKILEKI